MKSNKNTTNLFAIYALTAILLLIMLAMVPPISDHSGEWKKTQSQFLKMEAEKAKSGIEKEKIQNTPLEIKQIILNEIGVVDRCTTCHLGIDNPAYKEAIHPYRTHPNFNRHPFEKFGCTICHAGQGRATTSKAAHGRVKFWEEPMLPMEYIQSSCGKCHFSQDIPGAPFLVEGRQLFLKKGCLSCHRLGDKGGDMGPDITNEGRFGHRDPEWHFKHMKDPKSVVPDSTMKNYKFTDYEAKILTMYMLSLTDEKMTSYLSSKMIIPDVTTGKNLFMEKGCIGCHSIGGKGGNVGPELINIAERRNADWLFRHFKEPQKITPGSVMPQFRFTDDEAKALTIFLLSLSEKDAVSFFKEIGKK